MPDQFALINTLKRTGSQISKSLTEMEMDRSRPKEETQQFDLNFFKVEIPCEVNAKTTPIFAYKTYYIWRTITP